MTDDIPWLSAVEIASRVRAGDLSPVDVVEAFLSRIERRNPDTNAYVTVCADRAAAFSSRSVPESRDLPPEARP